MDTLRSDSLQLAAVSRVFASSPAFDAARPSVRQVLRQVGPLPEEALFLGMAEDDSPVLLNLHNPAPGPLLIVGREGAGKTVFLQAIAHSVEFTHSRGEVQYGVITNRVEEWQGALMESPGCIGVFASDWLGAKRLVQSLAMWIARIYEVRQSILLLVDGLEDLRHWDAATQACLAKVLAHGPAKRVWTLATLRPRHGAAVRRWLEPFRLRFFQHGLEPDESTAELCIPNLGWDIPVEGPWFVMPESGGWLRFWIPQVVKR